MLGWIYRLEVSSEHSRLKGLWTCMCKPEKSFRIIAGPQVLNQRKLFYCMCSTQTASKHIIIKTSVSLNGICIYYTCFNCRFFSALIIANWRNIFNMNYQICMMSSSASNTLQTQETPNFFTVILHLVPLNIWQGYDVMRTQVAGLNEKKMENSFRKPQAEQAIYHIYNEWLWVSKFLGFTFSKK